MQNELSVSSAVCNNCHCNAGILWTKVWFCQATAATLLFVKLGFIHDVIFQESLSLKINTKICPNRNVIVNLFPLKIRYKEIIIKR